MRRSMASHSLGKGRDMQILREGLRHSAKAKRGPDQAISIS